MTSQMLGDLAFELAKAGFEIVVITSRQTYENPQANLKPSEIVNGVRIERVWSTRFIEVFRQHCGLSAAQGLSKIMTPA